MVFVVGSSRGRGPGRVCAALPAPRPSACYWQQAARVHQARLVLPAFSLRNAKQPSHSQALFASCQAELPLDEAQWALAASLRDLSSLHGPGESLQRQVQPEELPQADPGAASAHASAVPAFLLLTCRTPRMDCYLQLASTEAEVPILVTEFAGGESSVGKKYECSPKLLPEQPTTAAPRIFNALQALLQLAPGPAAASQPQLAVPLPLPADEGGEAAAAAAGHSMRLEMEQLASCSFGPAGASAADLAASRFVSVKELPNVCLSAEVQSLEAVPTKLAYRMAAPALAALPKVRAPLTALPSFLLDPSKPRAAADSKAAGSGAMASALFMLDAPVLLYDSPAADAAADAALGGLLSAFADLFQPVDVPPAAGEPCFAPSSCTPVSLASLVAQDMVLHDGGLVLPAVTICSDGSGGGEEGAGTGSALLPLIQAECGGKPASTVHLALYLDWSLSSKQATTRPPELMAAARRMHQQLLPAHYTLSGSLEGRHRAALVEQLLSAFQVPGTAPGTARATHTLPAAAQKALRVQLSRGPASRQQDRPGKSTPAAESQGGQQQAAKRAKRGTAQQDGMQYFLQLQRKGAAPAAAASSDVGNAAPASSSSSGEAVADALELHLRQPSTSVHSVELPASHAQLLHLLQGDEQRLVQAAPPPGVAPEVARSHFLSVDELQRALEQAAGKPGTRQLLKTYAAMAVIRQTAATLAHHGICCAHLYLSQSQAELPGLLSAVTAARELRSAFLQVVRAGWIKGLQWQKSDLIAH
ncbi:hypothetical protein D9Q98_008724 [Chlorella vulgaris]|uniref:Uncharacterized protein n=1 Tax=Chlorella vulgaris TaxID=3077 RepID=A0A9D4TIH9_CHLVU|nr:hypothetical protein D9Q98_008724 [Chlorella vulgaris]